MNRNYFNKQVVLSSDSSEEEVGKVIELVRIGKLSKNVLIDILSERHQVYQERPTYQMNRIKGYAMASFAEVGLPDSAQHFLLDELQNGRNAYMVAAAAHGIRGAKQPGSQYVPFLLQALDNMRYHDDSMSFDVFKPAWPLEKPTTAKRELFLTLKWLQGYAIGALPELKSFLKNTYDFDSQTREEIQSAIDAIESDSRKLNLSCCKIEGKEEYSFTWLWKGIKNIKSIEHLQVENQDGMCRSLESFINRKPTVIAFFYTRCMNPNKCTLTINKLGWLQKELLKFGLQGKVNLLAFTYDPSYDTPTKMHVFGENRGIYFGDNAHLLRTRQEDFKLLSIFFQLGVNHVSSSVNQHRLELFLLDQDGSIKTSYTRLQWEVEKVFGDIKSLLETPFRFEWISSILKSLQHVAFPVLLLFFPKCPVCWGVYLSAFGVSSLQSIPYSPWLIPWIMLAMVINLVILYRKLNERNGFIPFWISLVGGVLVLGPGYLYSNQFCSITGIIFITVGAFLNSLNHSEWSKLVHMYTSIYGKRPL
ncbi:MAG: SCO family protein [Bacteroidota bacterium]